MKCYVFRDVLRDWTSGSAVVIANSHKEAVDLFRENIRENGNDSFGDYLEFNVDENESPRVVNCTWGGG